MKRILAIVAVLSILSCSNLSSRVDSDGSASDRINLHDVNPNDTTYVPSSDHSLPPLRKGTITIKGDITGQSSCDIVRVRMRPYTERPYTKLWIHIDSKKFQVFRDYCGGTELSYEFRMMVDDIPPKGKYVLGDGRIGNVVILRGECIRAPGMDERECVWTSHEEGSSGMADFKLSGDILYFQFSFHLVADLSDYHECPSDASGIDIKGNCTAEIDQT